MPLDWLSDGMNSCKKGLGSDQMMEIYYAPPSIHGRKVLAVLYEKNLDFEVKKMSFERRDQTKEAYLKLNPNGEIPTLVDDGLVVYESTAIVEYLNDEYPVPPLMPESSYERAKVRMIEDLCDLRLYPAVFKLTTKASKKQELGEADQGPFVALLKRIETFLGKQEYLVGNFSLADCAFMPLVPSLEAIGLGNLFSQSEGMKAYVSRLRTRAGWRGASLFSIESKESDGPHDSPRTH